MSYFSDRSLKLLHVQLCAITLLTLLPLFSSCSIYEPTLPDNYDSDRVLSRDAFLSEIQISSSGNVFELSPAFSYSNYEYDINVPIDTTEVAIFASPRDIRSTVNGMGSFVINPGETTAVIKVYAEEDYMYKEYYLTFHNTGWAATQDSSLSSLSLTDSYGNPVSFSPAFSSDVYSYTATASSGINIVNIGCSVTDTGRALANYPQSVDLEVGDNTIYINVTAEDGVYRSTYAINITRQTPPTISIATPVAGDNLTNEEVAASGSYNDPYGEIDSIVIGDFSNGGLSFSPCSMNSSMNTWEGIYYSDNTPSPKTVYAVARDNLGRTVAIASQQGICDYGYGGTYSVSIPFDAAGTVPDGSFLSIRLTYSDTGNTYYCQTGIPISDDDFPVELSVNVYPAMFYVTILITDSQDLGNARVIYQGETDFKDITTNTSFPKVILNPR